MIEPLEDRIAPANLAFAVGGGGVGNQNIEQVAVDHSGNTYVVGTFQGTVDFDPGTATANVKATAGQTDAFVAKYTGTGALAWVDVIRASNESAHDLHLAVTQGGDVFVYSYFGQQAKPTAVNFFQGSNGTASLPQVNQIGGPTDVYVAKLDTTGAFIWAKAYGTTNSVGLSADDIAVDNQGGIYMTGTFDPGPGPGSVSFDGFALSGTGGDSHLFVVKLQDGDQPSVVWANDTTSAGGGNNHHIDAALAVDGTGNVFVAGDFQGTETFGATLVSAPLAGSGQEIFFARLDNAGNWSWAGQVSGTSGDDSSNHVAVDTAGNVYVTGNFAGTADLDPGAGTQNLISAGSTDAFLLKLDATGGFLSVKQWGGAGKDEVGPIALDGSDHIYLAGSFSGTVDFGGAAGVHALTSAGPDDLFLLTLDSNGNFVSVAQVNGTVIPTGGTGFYANSDQGGGGGFTVDGAGGMYLAGAFRGSFDPGMGAPGHTLTSKGGTDFFIAHYFPGDLVAQDLQQPVLAQSFSLGSAGDQQGGPVITDAAGNLYLAGLFSGTVNFDHTGGVANLTSTDANGNAEPDGNVFIAKYNALGALQWVQQVKMSLTFDNNADRGGVELALDSTGNVYLATEYDVAAKLGGLTVTNSEPTPPAGTSSRDIFFAKLASDGTPLWAKSIGTAGQNDFVDAFAVRPSTRDVVLGGDFAGIVDFNPAGGAPLTAVNGANGQNDGYVVELNTAGAFQWVRQLAGAASQASVDDIGFLSGGDVVATGTFKGTVDFNYPAGISTLTSTTSSPGDEASFAARFTAATGAAVWSDGFGGSSAPHDNRAHIAISATDEIFVAGKFTGAQDFDPGIGTKILIESGGSQGDIFLQKLDASGALLGAVSFGGPGADGGVGLVLNGSGSLYLVGVMGKTIDLDPGPGIAMLTGATDSNIFVSRFDPATLGFISGYRIAAFDSGATPPGNKGVGVDLNASGGFWVDANENTYINLSFAGSVDLDPAGAFAPLVSKGARDIVVGEFDPLNVFDAAHPRTFHDANGDLVTLKLSGPGMATYTLAGDAGDLADLADLTLSDTTLASGLSINVTPFGNGDGKTVAQKILTTQPGEHVGAIALGKTVTLGDGVNDAVVDLRVSGEIKTLTLGDIAANTFIQLGRDLPYNVAADATTPDTYNNHPTLTIGDVLGAGVQINVIGDGVTPAGKGGGGLGNVVIGSWAFPGFIRTTQSVGNFTVLHGDFLPVLQVDSNNGMHLGAATTANCGSMTISDGAWGSSGSEIEGNVKSFDADAFLLGATLTANAIGAVTVHGDYDGTITTTSTDPDSPAIPTFTVTSDFTGTVVSAAPLKKLNVKGDFMGSLTAPLIGSITAYSFIGATDGFGVPTRHITATAGGLGTVTSTAGAVTDYTIITAVAFKGFTVNLPKVTGDTVGLDNVHITAASIGNITVNLKAAPKLSGIDLIGIRDSTFATTNTGNTKATAGNIGAVSITLNGDSGIGIQNSSFEALAGTVSSPASTVNAQGNISVKITGRSGANRALEDASFAANSIGATTVSVLRGAAGGSALSAVGRTDFTATGAIGAMNFSGDATSTLVDDLKVWAGTTVGAVTVKTTDKVHGTLANTDVLAGQSLKLTGATAAAQLAALALAKLGAVNVSGSLTSTELIAGGSIGAVTVGRDLTGSLVFAGAMLGGDFTIGANDTYQRVASIGAVSVKNALSLSSVVAGVNPGDGIFGNGDDTIAAAVHLLVGTSAIGAISLESALTGAPTAVHQHAIEAAAISSVKLGGVAAPFLPIYLGQAPLPEDATDILIRTI